MVEISVKKGDENDNRRGMTDESNKPARNGREVVKDWKRKSARNGREAVKERKGSS